MPEDVRSLSKNQGVSSRSLAGPKGSPRFMKRSSFRTSHQSDASLDTRSEADKLREEVEKELGAIMARHPDVRTEQNTTGGIMQGLSVMLGKSYAETGHNTKDKTPWQQKFVLRRAVKEEITHVQEVLDRCFLLCMPTFCAHISMLTFMEYRATFAFSHICVCDSRCPV
jgi:hypothetical protein